MFVTLSFIGGGYSNLILCLILIFYLIGHIVLYPFKHKRNNRIETFCILSLLIGFIGINFEDIANSVFLSLFLGIVIFMPVVIAIYYLFRLCVNCYRYYEGNDQYFVDSQNKSTTYVEERMIKIKNRVLAKRDSYMPKKAAIDLPPTTTKTSRTYTDDGSVGIEMATISLSARRSKSHDGNQSDTSCGLSE